MSFFEDRIPDAVGLDITGGPNFSTEVVKTQGGQRYANKNWLYPLHRFRFGYAGMKEREILVHRSFFYNVAGRADGFRFKDWGDYKATRQPLSLITGSIYQLNQTYVRGLRTFTRPIYKPVNGKVTVFRTRAGVTSSISPTIDTTNGQITVSGHVAGDSYSWTGEFDVPVVFNSDAFEAQIVNKGAEGFILTWPSKEIEEIRL